MYQAEAASKLGHLDVLQSDHVNQLVNEFESLELNDMNVGDASS